MIYPIIELFPIKDFRLLAKFSNSEKRLYDMNPTIDSDNIWYDGKQIFKELKNTPELFDKAKIYPLGYGVIWTDDIDLDSEDIYYVGKELTEEEYFKILEEDKMKRTEQ